MTTGRKLRSIMAQDKNHLIWIDMEMSGLNPASDLILEVALVVTDSKLETVAEAPVLVVHQSDAVLARMDSWNTATHTRTGLIERVKRSIFTESEVAVRMLEFLTQHVPANASPMCGNSICQDRRFLAAYMPELEAYFHYRNLDVSTLKELAKRWKPEISAGFAKKSKHEALGDIYESIEELKYYRDHLMRL
jgi:oligoribonuclease